MPMPILTAWQQATLTNDLDDLYHRYLDAGEMVLAVATNDIKSQHVLNQEDPCSCEECSCNHGPHCSRRLED